MSTHVMNYKKVPRSVHRLNVAPRELSSPVPVLNEKFQSGSPNIGMRLFSSNIRALEALFAAKIMPEMKSQLKCLFDVAMDQKAILFSISEDPS